MTVEIFKPSAPLSDLIDHYLLVDINWATETGLANVWRLIPYGQVSMLFLYGDPHEYSMKSATEAMHYTSRAFMVGPLTQPIWLKFSGHTRLIKIQFKSSGAQHFLPVNMEQFRNVPNLDLEILWGNTVKNLLRQIEACHSDVERILTLNDFLEKRRLPQSPLIDYVDYTIQQIKATNGNLSINQLEQKLGIGTRQLERLFRTKMGLSAKEMCKMIRLNFAFSSLQLEPDLSLTSLSYDAGYYDQSHFNKDFKSLTGLNPSKLLSKNSKELFVTHGACFVKQKSHKMLA